MVLEILVQLVALMHLMRVVCESLLCVVEEAVQLLDVPLQVLFHTLSITLALLPDLELRVKFGESLLDFLGVQNA